MYHYLHMAEGNFRKYLQTDIVRVKKYFYVLRPILACKWIEKKNTMAPMEFQKLVASQVKNERLRKEIDQLLTRKLNGEELDKEPKIQILNEFIEKEIEYFNEKVKEYDLDKKPDTEKLNNLFRAALREAW